MKNTNLKVRNASLSTEVHSPKNAQEFAPNKLVIEELILEHRESSRKLARSLLNRWNIKMSTDDINSTVDLALCEAAQRYNPKKGAQFMTFVFYHVRGYLLKTVDATFKYEVEPAKIRQEQGEAFESFTSEYSDEHLGMFVAPAILQTPEDSMIQKETIEVCRKACAVLDDLEREIIERSFVQEQSLIEIAKDLGYGRHHLSRVRKAALILLRKSVLKFAGEVLPGIKQEKSNELRNSVRTLKSKRGTRGRRELETTAIPLKAAAYFC